MSIKNNHWLQNISVVALVVIVAALQANVHVLAKGLLATPFLVIVAAAAIISDVISSALAIFLGAMAVDYVMPPAGFKFGSTVLLKSLEFFLSGIVVYLLALRGNTLQQSNLKLIAATKQLQGIVKKLKAEVKGSTEQVAKLNSMNTELRSLVDEFMADDTYWARKWRSMKKNMHGR